MYGSIRRLRIKIQNPGSGRENLSEIVEVFTVRGRIMEDAKCPCGYVFSAEEPDTLVVEKKEEE